MSDRFDHVWLVTCDPDVRRERLVDRGWTPEEADRRMAAGSPIAPRRALADVEIDNSGTYEETVRQLERAFEALMADTQGDDGR